MWPLCWVVLLTVIVPLGYRATGWLLRYDARPKTDALASQAGRDLFLHEWTPGDPLAAQGDGLGPVFNASSCVACHQQGGAGGSGSLEHNVTVFTRAPIAGAGATQGVIHQFAIDAASQETLQNVSAEFPKKSRPTLADCWRVYPSPPICPPASKPSESPLSPKSTSAAQHTALFGASVIDAIPDAAILANERNQHMNTPVGPQWRKVSAGRAGSFPQASRKIRLEGEHRKLVRVRAGRVRQRAGARQSFAGPAGIAIATGLSSPRTRSHGPAVRSDDGLHRLAAAAPGSDPRLSGRGRPRRRGKKHFKQIGCTNCHTPDLAEAQGIYSDLLLHQMGEELGGGGSYGEESPDVGAGLRRRPDVPKRMAHAAAVGCCRFRSLSSRRPSSDPGRGHQAARRSGGLVCKSLHGSLRRPARRADCVPEHAASPERFVREARSEGPNIQ